ncbi:LLM class flavin-dependent oxidoreductase [Paenibacillus polymyxa]|uniref:LLM class flavin-dependent oxidoreductase n=1 Tax=Paenibacillus polymyxa TaxID=1406 RepID=UPI001F20CC66|nr:LLM class flavin-dependent oxidoreductase [Paenibacillus polymyxa]
MKFVLFSLMANLPNAITGEAWSSQQKFQNVIKQAVLAEELGFDAYGVGAGGYRRGSDQTLSPVL